MTMTPEPKIMHSPLSGCWYLVTKYKARKDGGFEALKKIDISDEIEKVIAPLTAEIATLKAEVEHYRTQLEQTCHGTEVLGDEIATLRTHLKAVVEAGEKVLLRHDGTFYTESMNDSGAVDALRSALEQAKGAV